MAALPATAYAVSLVVAISPQNIHSGTAFAVASDAHMTKYVTAAHVVENASRVVLVFQDGSDFTAMIVARDRIRDAAILSIGVGNRPVLTVSQKAPNEEDAVTIIGYPGPRQFAVDGSDVRLIGSADPTVVAGTVQTVQQRGESIVFKADVGHGDSGAPIIDTTTNSVIGVTTGRFRGSGILLEFNGMDIGLSSAGLNAVLHPALPANGARPPQYVVAIAATPPFSGASSLASLVDSTFVANFAQQADFVGVDAPPANDAAATCRSANANAVANVTASADGALVAAGLIVSDCIGNPFYAESQSVLADQDSTDSVRAEAVSLATQLAGDFNGWVDARRSAWTSLLRYGIAVAPSDSHYYALMRLGAGELNASRVIAVMPRGPAAIAGLRKGDALASIDGRDSKVMSPDDVTTALDRPTVQLSVKRGRSTLTMTLHPRRFAALLRLLGYSQ